MAESLFLQMRRNRKSASSRHKIDDWLWRASTRGGISLVSSCCSLPPEPSTQAIAWPSSFSALPLSAQFYRATKRQDPRAVTWARFPATLRQEDTWSRGISILPEWSRNGCNARTKFRVWLVEVITTWPVIIIPVICLKFNSIAIWKNKYTMSMMILL